MGDGAGAQHWRSERRLLRKGPGTPYRKLQTLGFLATRDRRAVLDFLAAQYPNQASRWQRIELIRRFMTATNALRGYHTLSEMLTVTDRILRLSGRPGLTVVEAGAGSGSSTVKLSLATELAGGRLLVFDTFRGIPDNDERHVLRDGRTLQFARGAFRGRLGAVQQRVARFGCPAVCSFHKGLFADSLPGLGGPVDVALLDVDLVASTRSCLTHIFPRLRPGGCVLSQDGHLMATHQLLADEDFWRREVACEPPTIRGLNSAKLLEIEAPSARP